MSDDDKLLPDMDVDGVKTKKTKRKLADVPTELPIENDKENDTDTETETESDSDSDSDLDSEYECTVCNKKFSGFIPFKQHQKGKKHAKAVLKKKKAKKLLEEGEDDKVSDEDYLTKEPYAVCEICDKQFTGPESYYLHKKSKTHKHKVLEASILDQVREKGEINVDKLKELYKSKQMTEGVLEDTQEMLSQSQIKDDIEKVDNEFQCKECEKVFSGLIPFTQHLMSKNHAKHVEKKTLLDKVLPGSSENDETSGKSRQTDISTLCLENDVLFCKLCSTAFSGSGNAMMHLKSKNHSKNLEKYVRKLQRKKEKKELKNLESGSNENKKGDDEQPLEKREGSVTKEEPQHTSDLFSEHDIPDNIATGETTETSTSNDNKEGPIDYNNYKKYKELMKSLREEDTILK